VKLHTDAYLYLRTQVHEHMRHHRQPELRLYESLAVSEQDLFEHAPTDPNVQRYIESLTAPAIFSNDIFIEDPEALRTIDPLSGIDDYIGPFAEPFPNL